MTDWHEYITGSPYQAWKGSADYQKYMHLSECLQAIYALGHGDLRNKNCAKQIIKEPTQAVAIEKGYAPYSFRFQCLATGRQSKFIKEDDYALYGITKQDMADGGSYPEKEDIPDRFEHTKEVLSNHMTKLRERAFPSNSTWWTRYAEYLRSEKWYEKREAVLTRDDRTCQVTGSTRNLQIHHLNYDMVGDEPLEHLVTLNAGVHASIHDSEHPKHIYFVEKLSKWVQENI